MTGERGGTALEVRDVTVRFGETNALAGVSLRVKASERLVVVGPSGGGKTTLLRVIAGLTEPDVGSVHINDVDVTDTPPERRGTSMVFQSHALFPFRTVADNVGYGLTLRRIPGEERRTRVDELLAAVRLDGLGERFPSELSGGQQQRVALARALIVDPSVLLLDEPFSSLDPELRDDLRETVAALQRRLGTTMVLVTHDRTDAQSLGDRVAVLADGRIELTGAPTNN